MTEITNTKASSRVQSKSPGRPVAKRPAAFGEPKPSVRAWVRMLRATEKIERALARDLKDRWGLNLAQFEVLAHVGSKEGLAQGDLADSLLVTKGNVVQMLDKMERLDLVLRQPEGRTNHVFLTRKGRNLYEEVVPSHEALVDEQLSSLSEVEQEYLLKIVGKLNRALG